jgi:hypothetical protein
MHRSRPQSGRSLDTSTGSTTFQVRGWLLVVPPFRIEKYGQTFINPVELRIDLRSVRPGRYRIVAVHNFQVEDRNPNLDEALGGIFLAARRADGSWEEPESFPVECRTLEVLGHVDVGSEGASAGG